MATTEVWGHEGAPQSPTPPAQLERYRDLTAERFAGLVRRGIPFIVEDAAGPQWEISSWKCSTFTSEFPNFRLRQEYSKKQKRGDPGNYETFGSVGSFASVGGKKQKASASKAKANRAPWWTEKRPNNIKDLPEDAPKYAPFYWDFAKASQIQPERGWLPGDEVGKRVQRRSGKEHKEAAALLQKTLQRVRGLAHLPAWVDVANTQDMNNSLEFWLQPSESGSAAHIDGDCGAAIAFTFGGREVRKRWRLQMLPPTPVLLEGAYSGGEAYRTNEWSPTWVGDTRHGDAIVFFPGMLHEGVNVSPPARPDEDFIEAHDEACIVGMTYRLSQPLPTGVFRQFHPRLRRAAGVGNCQRRIQDLALFGVDQPLLTDVDRAREIAQQRALELDSDSDGTVSPEEAVGYYTRSKAGYMSANGAEARRCHLMSCKRRKVSNELPRWDDLLDYHDTSADGNISFDEAVAGMHAFALAEAQIRWEDAEQSRRRLSEQRLKWPHFDL